MEPNLNSTPEQREIMQKIVERAEQNRDWSQSRIDAMMDLTAVNNSVGLNLQKLLDFKPFDFWHDLVGIYENINRTTGELENGFIPRSAARYWPKEVS